MLKKRERLMISQDPDLIAHQEWFHSKEGLKRRKKRSKISRKSRRVNRLKSQGKR